MLQNDRIPQKQLFSIKSKTYTLKRLEVLVSGSQTLNTTLDEAIASAESDIRNNNINRSCRKKAERLFADCKKSN